MAAKTYGTVSSEQQKAMTGLEFVKGLASGELPLNTIAQTLGYDVVEAENGRVAITVHPTGAHLNPWGTAHGGLTATLLDSCMGLAIQSMLDKGIGSTTLEFKISLVRAITLEIGRIRAEGKVLNVAVVSAQQKAASSTPTPDCLRTVRRRASFSRTSWGQTGEILRMVRVGARREVRLFPATPIRVVTTTGAGSVAAMLRVRAGEANSAVIEGLAGAHRYDHATSTVAGLI